MKKLFFFATILSLASPFVCCKSKKAATKTTETAAATSSTSENTEMKYRLIVSFISKGEGTDSEKRTSFLNFVNGHAKKPAYKTVNWGREGETDYCFTLSELLKKEQIEFINQVRKSVSGSDLVSISEDAECMHKGR